MDSAGHCGLGNFDGNLTLEEFVDLVWQATGVRVPLRRPSRLRGVRRMLQRPAASRGHLPAALTCNCRRAVEELGMPQTPLLQALAEAAEWFREHGYVE